MDTEHIRRDTESSFRLIGTHERRLLGGTALALVVYTLWVGATAAALVQFAEIANISTAVDPWTGKTTALAVAGGILWLLVPAVVTAVLLNRAVTNRHGKLEKHYRVRHPATLLVAPLVGLLLGIFAVLLLGEAHRATLVIVLLVSVFVHVRTLVYAYRVFSLSLPRLVASTLVLTVILGATTFLVEGALAVGREDLVAGGAAGIERAVGVDGVVTFTTGTTTVAGIELPILFGAAIATPLVLSGGYLLVQSIASLIVRVRSPTVARSELRTGQRYPAFAKPTVSKETRASQSRRDATRTTTPNNTDEIGESVDEDSIDDSEDEDEDDTDQEDDIDDVSHTRVFRPPAEDGQTMVVDDVTDESSESEQNSNTDGRS